MLHLGCNLTLYVENANEFDKINRISRTPMDQMIAIYIATIK